ncbi:MAG: GNAT family N-acetyltransferase, partial [Deltaproteobacteria bacterium]|nr:GNAT family N-acetyltransferase [Deltaproteobacteria bacterium]
MKIIDLTDDHLDLYCLCLEDWSAEMQEAGDHKRRWYDLMRDKGLRVKLALDDVQEVGGMIQYLPIEHSFAEGKDLYIITCVWVHGHKQGRGNFQKRGMGSALLAAAEEDARALGAKGIAAWGLVLPIWMKASWYKKHGYKNADRQ